MSATGLNVCLFYNEPGLAPDNTDWAAEAGVLEAVSAIEPALRDAGHRVRRVAVRDSLSDVIEQLTRAPRDDVVFNLCEGAAGNPASEAHWAGILELLGLPYTGSPPHCLALARDKGRVKWLLRGAGLPTADFALIAAAEARSSMRTRLAELVRGGPVIVKPDGEDASQGIGPDSVATDVDGVCDRVEKLRARYGEVLVERFIEGREINVGVVNFGEPTVLPLSEIEFQPDASLPWPIVTYDAKWSSGSAAELATPPRCPAPVDEALASELRRVALAAFELLQCRDYARVDFRIDRAGQVYVLEVNANPDLSPNAGLAHMLAAAEIPYETFVDRLIKSAHSRNQWMPCPPSAPSAKHSPFAIPHSPLHNLSLRPPYAADIPRLVQILRDCRLFRPDEVDTGEEVLREAAACATRESCADDYRVVVAEIDGRPVGWAGYGLVPMTQGSYDLYWIAVDPKCQGRGIGQRLMFAVERDVVGRGGYLVLAETSDTAEYVNTRSFYLRSGYRVASKIADFYRPGDGRVIFAKNLS